jgi:integrase
VVLPSEPGTARARAVIDKLRDLHHELDTGISPKAGYAHYTVPQAADDWLAHGLEGRSPKTIKKNQNVLQPILKVIGARKLRDLSAADVRQALATMAPCAGPRQPGRRPGRQPARPAAHRRLAISPHPRRHQDRTVPPHPRPPRRRGQALRAWSAVQAEERLGAGDDWQDTGLVFTSHHGAALDASNVRKMFKRVCDEAGIGDSWAPRELRTSFVSLMSHQGVSIEEIARLVGHATTRTTEIVYRRELRPVITTGAEIMDQLFTAT